MNGSYMTEIHRSFTPDLVIKEASRCLLCSDAPCSKSCPANTQPDRFIRSVYFRNFKGAAEIIRENNALGAICARVCPTEKLCQCHCTRGKIDTPIDIGRIQQFVTDFEASTNMQILKRSRKNAGKVAIIGAGPAGLQASATLSQLDYDVDIYDKAAQSGGWLRYGIPEFRLPTHVVDHEIDRIKNIGVNFINNIEIGNQLTIEELKLKYDAILLATGMSFGSSLSLFKDNPYVDIAVNFLSDVKSNQGNYAVPATVLVIGGGDVAMDTVTTLKTIGCQKVYCIAREELVEFPASKDELSLARSMNISIFDGFTPIDVKDNTVTFEHVREKAHLRITVDKIILAVGQHSQLSDYTDIDAENGIVSTTQYRTSDARIFAAGDIVKGDKMVVYAVKTGKEAAFAIDNYLKGEKKC